MEQDVQNVRTNVEYNKNGKSTEFVKLYRYIGKHKWKEMKYINIDWIKSEYIVINNTERITVRIFENYLKNKLIFLSSMKKYKTLETEMKSK